MFDVRNNFIRFFNNNDDDASFSEIHDSKWTIKETRIKTFTQVREPIVRRIQQLSTSISNLRIEEKRREKPNEARYWIYQQTTIQLKLILDCLKCMAKIKNWIKERHGADQFQFQYNTIFILHPCQNANEISLLFDCSIFPGTEYRKMNKKKRFSKKKRKH